MAHVKAAGSSNNGRDSNPRYRGVKLFGGQQAIAWNVIVRQQGLKMEPGKNVYSSRDFTLHAEIDWLVTFSRKRFMRLDGRQYVKTVVNVIPAAEAVSLSSTLTN